LLLVAESPESVNVLLLGRDVDPKAISEGLKVQVPGEQERAMVSVKLGTRAVMDIGKVVVVIPIG
jgi:hypothetical protein